MSATFVYKDVHGNTIDEGGRLEPMGYIVERYAVLDKATFFELKIEAYISASAAEKQLGIHVRTTQK